MSNNLTFKQANLPDFYVAGIAVNTTNQNGQSQKDIGELWTRFMMSNISSQIVGKVSDDLYCVYTNYESDYTGTYTAVLGYRVERPDNQPADLCTVLVEGGPYRVYSPQGKFPESVANAWMHIWNTPISRKYAADYDCYKANATSFEDTEVQIYLGVQ